MRIGRLNLTAGLCALAALALCKPAFPTDEVALIISTSLYNSTGVATRLLQYKGDVEARFPVHLTIYNGASFDSYTPQQMRSYIQNLYSTSGIKGVLLVGQIQYALWKNYAPGADDKGINSFYYEDMDGTFTDTNADGYDDLHDWGPHIGPEVWCCWMRPPASNQVSALNAFLDKTHSYYTGGVTVNRRALIACHADYDGNIRGGFMMFDRLAALYGNNVDIDGEGSDLVVASDQVNLLNANRYEIYDPMGHANSTLQAWDSGYVYYTTAQSLTGGALMTFIYGCHSAAFNEASSTNIAQAYCFGSSIGQAASGTSWNYGTEGKWYIFEELARGGCLGKAWMNMEIIKNTPQYMKDRYGQDFDANQHLWGDTLIGNPFLFAHPIWYTINGPVTESATAYNHIGTDGTSLYVVFSNNQLWKYAFSTAAPLFGSWSRLADPPKTVCTSNSWSDLTYQDGYLYTTALGDATYRKILRYKIADNSWTVWQNAGSDLLISKGTGNGLFMDPARPGVGYCAFAGGYYWVKFDWNAKTANNAWLSTSGLGVTDANWVSANEDIARGSGDVYYATKNDKTAGLSSGDVIYKWTGLTSPTPTVLVQKPWQAGLGQSIEFISRVISGSGSDELWLIRGADGSSNPGFGYGTPTTDWARLNLTSLAWTTDRLPGTVGYNGEIVLVNGVVFVRGQDDKWYVKPLVTTAFAPIAISDAKTLSDGSAVGTTGFVSGVFNAVNQFYVQDPGTPCGIQVRCTATLPSLKQGICLTGQIRTDSTTRERYIDAPSWWPSGVLRQVMPLGLNTYALGGAALGLQDGVYEGQGLNNVGLLVRVAGSVTGKAADNSYIYAYDGSAADDGNPDGYKGVKLDLSAIAVGDRPSPAIGDLVVATGISSMYQSGGNHHRTVRLRSAGDFQNLGMP